MTEESVILVLNIEVSMFFDHELCCLILCKQKRTGYKDEDNLFQSVS